MQLQSATRPLSNHVLQDFQQFGKTGTGSPKSIQSEFGNQYDQDLQRRFQTGRNVSKLMRRESDSTFHFVE
jgi:hypothetical protein